jgi:hypothetical protein
MKSRTIFDLNFNKTTLSRTLFFRLSFNLQSFSTALFIFSLVFEIQELMKKIVELQLSSWRCQPKRKKEREGSKDVQGKRKSFVQHTNEDGAKIPGANT